MYQKTYTVIDIMIVYFLKEGIMEKDFLSNVYGYNKIKKELYTIRDWYFSKKEGSNYLLPRGILLYGEPGCGKTLIIREYARSFNYPIFVIEGKGNNIQEEVCSIYEKARKEKNAIVVIDELDRLIKEDDKLVRVIMSNLDGFDNNMNVLTLASCNDYSELPEALIREGRFDRHFFIGKTSDDIKEIITSFAGDVGITLNQDDLMELTMVLEYFRTSEIKAIFNNVALRYGNNYTIDGIIDVINALRTGFVDKDENYKVKRYMAIHEAGHAIYSYVFCKTKYFLRIFFNDFGGRSVCKDLDGMETKESRIEHIRVGLAGIVAEDIILKGHDVGCGIDLEDVYNTSFRLINRTCINGLDYFAPSYAVRDRSKISNKAGDIYERKTNEYIKENYQIVKKGLKKYKKKILELTDYLIANKGIRREEFIRIMNNN